MNSILAALSALLLLLPDLCFAQAVTPTKEGVLKIGMADLKSPLSIRASPAGTLVVLDRRDPDGYALVTYAPDGQKLEEVSVPAGIEKPKSAVADAAGNFYLMRERDTKIYVLHPGAPVSFTDLKTYALGLAVSHAGSGDSLLILGDNKAGITRLSLPGLRPAPAISLTGYPVKGSLTELRVRPDGHLYAFSDAESLVYHFDPTGRFIEKIGGGGPHPPKVGVPAGCMGPAYDVAPNGDVWWTMGDYGALILLSADGTTGVAYHGQEAETTRWTGPLYTVTGLALAGDHAFETDGMLKRVTGFPLSLAASGAPQTDTVDARVFGFSYRVVSDAPYQLFTGATAPLRIAFAEGNRRVHAVALDYLVYDLNHQLVSKGTVPMNVPGSAAVEVALPPLPMPRLGWYQLETALRTGDTVLQEQVHFFARVQEDPRMPIPTAEATGWNDIATHRMIGLGLHRFGGNMKALLDARPKIEAAEAVGLPWFLAITDEKDCTPENVTALLQAYPAATKLEIVNEPNLRMPVEKYVEVLKPCYAAAKAANPKIQVMGPTQCGMELNWFESFFKNGGGSCVDIVSVHTYERNNSMDAWHWNWKLNRLREILTQYGCGGKPIYQTEHGFLGDYHGPLLRHRWQARSLLLELMALAPHGIGLGEYYYYYVNQGGFANFSAYLADTDRELLPAAVMTRSRTHFLAEEKFDHALDFGDPGNLLVLGNLYRGPAGDVVELVNCGALRPVEVLATLPAGALGFDCFGNPVALVTQAGVTILGVGMYPTYLVLPPGSASQFALAAMGANIAPQAKISVTDAAGNSDAQAMTGMPRLTNGRMEFDFENEPERVGMRATDGNLPLDLTLDLGGVHKVSGAILYSTLADNAMAAPLEYELQVRASGKWYKADTITVPADSRSLKLGGTVQRLTWYDAPWIFVHRFTPVAIDAVRFHFTKTTNGQYPTPELNTEVSLAFGGDGKPMPQHVELREVQVFEAP